MNGILGIDIAKEQFAVLLVIGGQEQAREFENTVKGMKQLSSWLKKLRVTSVQAVMEATGRYGEELAEHLHAAGYVVYVVNPLVIKRYAQQELMRNKTDGVDTGVMARWLQIELSKGEACKHRPWKPAPPEVKELQRMSGRYDDLTGMLTQEKNRKQAGNLTQMERDSIEAMLTVLKAQKKRMEKAIAALIKSHPELLMRYMLLRTIKGIGAYLAAKLIAFQIEKFEDAHAFSAFAGLTPRQHASGKLRKPARISKIGHPVLRQALYMPTINALVSNPLIAAFAQRLREKTRLKGKQIIVAAMHKLLRIAYGVVKSGKAFDPTYKKPVKMPSAA
jgi:transposase